MMNKKLSFLFCLLYFLGSAQLSAQSDPSGYTFIQVKDGISKRGINSIVQDHLGFSWIGTFGAGIYKYDGLDYLSFQHIAADTTSINSNLVNCIYKDSKDQIWIGSENGLNLFDANFNRFIAIHFSSGRDSLGQDPAVVDVCENQAGDLLIGTNRYGLFLLKKGSKLATSIPYENNSQAQINVLDIELSAKGHIYAATSQGLKIFNADTGLLQDAIIYNNDQNQTLSHSLTSLWIDELDNLWMGSHDQGVFKTACINAKEITLKFLEHFPISQKRILSITADQNQHIICGTENDGLFILNERGDLVKHLLHDKATPDGLKSNSIWSLLADKEDRIWVGYYDKGVDVYDPRHKKFSSFESLLGKTNSLEAGSVTGIVSDAKGNIWIGMDSGGVDYYDVDKGKFTHFLATEERNQGSGLTSAAVQTVFIDSKENLWVGSWDGGLFLKKKGEDRFLNYTRKSTNGALVSDRIVTFAEDANGTIWLGTFGHGLNAYQPEKQQFIYFDQPALTAYGIQHSDVRKVLIDQKDQIWLGTTIGLFKLIVDGIELLSVLPFRNKCGDERKRNSSCNNILSLYEANNGDIWIGTDGAGLARFKPQLDSFYWYNEENGLGQQSVAAIIEAEDGTIWASGRSGVSSIDLQQGTIQNYTKGDGLLSNDFNYNSVYKDTQGTLYFGNLMGINYFNTATIPNNEVEVKVYLTDLKIFNEKALPGQKGSPLDKVFSQTQHITLNAQQSIFTIEYTGINFTRPDENQFAYYLEGLETDWNYVGNKRSATYNSLKSGDYVFKLKAANNDGLWSSTPIHLQITVLPPWYQSNTAILAYILLALGSLYLIYRLMRMRVLARKELEGERQRRQQEEEMNEKKFQFFTNISHEFRTPLTLIVNPLEDIIADHHEELEDEVQSKHLIIHKNAKRLERLINELMDFRKLNFDKMRLKVQATEVMGFVQNVVDYFGEEAIDQNIKLDIQTDLSTQMIWIDPGMIEKVLFNLLSNAFKVTAPGGQIQLILQLDEVLFSSLDAENSAAALSIAVSDTGPGLSAEHVDRIFERFYQVDTLNKAYYGGTGIGLEVVHNFVKLHKGEIRVESELDKGTTFIISLPLGNKHFLKSEFATAAVEQEENRLKESPGTTDENSLLVLVVEDNTELRNYLKTELKKTYKVITASNGEQGLSLALAQSPDIILADIVMPKMNGLALCQQIKTDLRTCHIPFILLTAKSSSVDQVAGIEQGADAYFNKPFDMRLLKAKMSQLLSSRQMIFNKYFSGISDTKIEDSSQTLDKEFLHTVLRLIHDRIGDSTLNVESIAAEVLLSRSQLYRKIKNLTGLSVNQFIRRVRLEEAKKLIEQGNTNITKVCYTVGFSSPSYFTKCFKEHFKVLPTEIVAHPLTDD